MFVTFSGRRNNISDYPQFVRWKYYTRLPGSLLCIDDPMLQKFKDLALGWFYGDHNVSWLSLTADVIRKVAELKHISEKNIFLFSSSGGGYAALHIGALLKNVNVIAINPQIYPQLWPYAPEFTKITGIDLHSFDRYARNSLHEILVKSSSKFLIIVNCASKRDFVGQIFPFCNNVNISPKYGLVNKSNCWLWTYSTDIPYRPHNAFETNSILEIIVCLAFNIRDENAINYDIYKIYSNVWNDYYSMYNEKVMKNTLLIKKCEILKQRLQDKNN